MRAAMDAAAETLGLEPAELKAALDEGATLADLASTAGVSTDDLSAAMSEALAETAPAEVAERLTSNLDAVISGERPARPPRPGRPDLTSAVDALSSALGTTTEELLESIESGTLAEVFAQAGVESQVGVLVDTGL